MTSEELGALAEQIKIAEQIKMYFLNQTMQLSNNEIKVVVEYLARYFNESMELLQQGTR